MSTNPIMNLERTLASLGGDGDLLSKIGGIFVRTTPDLLEKIDAAFAASDVKRVYTEAHTLKGSVGVFDVPEVFESVAMVSQHAKNGDLAAARTAFTTARPLVERLIADLASHTGPGSSVNVH